MQIEIILAIYLAISFFIYLFSIDKILDLLDDIFLCKEIKLFDLILLIVLLILTFPVFITFIFASICIIVFEKITIIYGKLYNSKYNKTIYFKSKVKREVR